MHWISQVIHPKSRNLGQSFTHFPTFLANTHVESAYFIFFRAHMTTVSQRSIQITLRRDQKNPNKWCDVFLATLFSDKTFRCIAQWARVEGGFRCSKTTLCYQHVGRSPTWKLTWLGLQSLLTVVGPAGGMWGPQGRYRELNTRNVQSRVTAEEWKPWNSQVSWSKRNEQEIPPPKKGHHQRG